MATEPLVRPGRAPILGSPAERWVASGVVIAWTAITAVVLLDPSGSAPGLGHAHDTMVAHTADGPGYPWTPAWLAMWVLMVVAMMWPLTLRLVASIERSSYRDWRAAQV